MKILDFKLSKIKKIVWVLHPHHPPYGRPHGAWEVAPPAQLPCCAGLPTLFFSGASLHSRESEASQKFMPRYQNSIACIVEIIVKLSLKAISLWHFSSGRCRMTRRLEVRFKVIFDKNVVYYLNLDGDVKHYFVKRI